MKGQRPYNISIFSGKKIISKDLWNLKQRAPGALLQAIRGVEEQTWVVLEELQKQDPGADVTTVKDDQGQVNLLFFQTSYMKSCFLSFGSVLSIDGTYCVNLTGYPLYVFLVVDGEGKGHVVGYALVKDERMATITCLFQEFVALNANSLSLIKTVIVDKDNSELGALKTIIPDANIILCRYHVVAAVSAAIHKKVRKQEVDIVIETVKAMVWAPTEAEFLRLLATIPEGEFLDYFKKCWLNAEVIAK